MYMAMVPESELVSLMVKNHKRPLIEQSTKTQENEITWHGLDKSMVAQSTKSCSLEMYPNALALHQNFLSRNWSVMED